MITWSWNGTNIYGTYGRAIPRRAGDMLATPSWRGANIEIPGSRGSVHTPKTIGEGRISLPIILRGLDSDGSPATDASEALAANWRALRRLIYSADSPGTLTRTISYPDGDVTHVATAEILPTSLVPALEHAAYGTTILDFALLSGCFYDASATEYDLPDTVDVDMDLPTDHVTITLSGGDDQVITNTATGDTLTLAADTTTDDAVIDCLARTVVQDGASIRHLLSYTGRQWMRVATGDALTLSGGGTASVAIKGAHL